LVEAGAFVGACVLLVAGLTDLESRWPLLVVAVGVLLIVIFTSGIQIRGAGGIGAYWWVGIVIPFGLGAWASFAYVGVRARDAKLVVASAGYLGAIVVGGILNASAQDQGSGSTAAALLWLVTWIVAGTHGYAIRGSVQAGMSSGDQRSA
jgi:hypothetical protein